MKKNIFLIASIFGITLSACDYNEHNFDGFDSETEPKEVVALKHTIDATDINSIAAALRANRNKQDSVLANKLVADKMFSETVKAADLIPYALKARYTGSDPGSSAYVAYEYNEGRDAIVSSLSTPQYVIADEDYQLVWGDLYPIAFTPAKTPEANIPVILKARFKDAVEGDFKNVEYQYSKEEPVDATVESSIWSENFESLGKYEAINIDGWQTQDLLGTFTWQGNSYNNNVYVQASSYKSGGKNDIWMISKVADFSGIANPRLSFDINVRNYTADCFSVLVSTDFNGKDIKAATWTNISKSFKIPSANMSDLTPAGSADLKAYTGKKVYIAFRYVGDDSADANPKKTTTYQVDNVNVYDAVPGVAVKEPAVVYAAYQYVSGKWQKAGSSVVSLQSAEYSAMGVQYLTQTTAPNYLPTYLKSKYPYAQEGETKQIVYRTNKTNCYADEYSYIKGVWTANNFVATKTDQFILVKDGSSKKWVFDPTIVLNMQKADYQVIVDYVIANQALNNPALIDRGNTEFYYGFNAYYPNITYRDKDRAKDPLYPVSGTPEEKEKFCNARTVEGLKVFLAAKYPNATPTVNTIVQKAELTCKVYSSHVSTVTTEIWTYYFECVGTKDWKFVKRVSLDTKEVQLAE